MRTRLSLGLLSLAVALLPSATLTAQTSTQAAGPQNKQIHLDVQVKGESELRPQDFTLLDNKTPRPITLVRAANNQTDQAEVILVVDAVNTPYTALGYQRDQIDKYLRSHEGMLAYPTRIAVLTDKSLEITPKATRNGMELADSLKHYDIGLRVIGRDQGFYGASDRMTISLNALKQLIGAEAKQPGRKLLLWLSPGWPLLSGPEVELSGNQQRSIYQSVVSFSTQLREANITLYSLNSWGASESLNRSNYYEAFISGVKKPGDAQLGNIGLQVLAVQSGGLVLNTSDVGGMIQQCTADADHYYELSFEPAPSDHPEEFHQLQVKVAGSGVRTRDGYYSRP
ncbi:VWA domain-containing protein [Granulicella paludicola]|uniref:VWA domain-containing protein n=1 Tax=Granulicella paludicola TaxID=474951 RepID=UPI0021DFF74D|nr:VWA domain-containing protein [Granulicella paludicola]